MVRGEGRGERYFHKRGNCAFHKPCKSHRGGFHSAMENGVILRGAYARIVPRKPLPFYRLVHSNLYRLLYTFLLVSIVFSMESIAPGP